MTCQEVVIEKQDINTTDDENCLADALKVVTNDVDVAAITGETEGATAETAMESESLTEEVDEEPKLSQMKSSLLKISRRNWTQKTSLMLRKVPTGKEMKIIMEEVDTEQNE